MYEFACANLSYPQRYSYTPFGGLKFFEVHKRLFEKYELAYNLRKERILRAKSKDFNNSKKSISFPDGQNYNIDKLEDIYKYGTDIIKAFESRKC